MLMTGGGGVIENPAAAAFGGVTGEKCRMLIGEINKN